MYNEAQQTEKYRFQKLLFELCRGLPNLEQTGSGRRWTPLADMVFACALKVYTTVSSRRFACDLKAAHDCRLPVPPDEQRVGLLLSGKRSG